MVGPRCSSSDECLGAESNHRHGDFQSPALPSELPRQAFPGAQRRAGGRSFTIVGPERQQTAPPVRYVLGTALRVGFGEVRDGASKTYALMLKSRLLGENPCNVDKLFRRIKQFGGHARQGGGVSAVEMALWDLAGKAYGVPVYQMLGGKFRDKIRCYATADSRTIPRSRGSASRSAWTMGFTFLKMDLGHRTARGASPAPVTAAAGTDERRA